MMNPMNHMATHFPGDGMGGYGQHHTGPGPGSPAQQQQQQQQQQQPMGGPVDTMNGFRGMQPQQQQQQQPTGNMFQPPMDSQQQQQQQQRSMMGSNAHMAGGQVVTNNMMNGSSMGVPMNGMMQMPQQQQQQMAPIMQQPHMMQQQQMNGPPQQQQQQHMHSMDGNGGQGVRACGGCGGKILERFLFHALDRFWHHGCLKCSCCGARLADIGVSCYTKAGMILCRADYVKLFGSSGACSACGQNIPANELVMRVGGAGPAAAGPGPNGIHPPAGGAVYHVKCFACTKCQTQLMPGDRYALIGGSLLCEQDCHKMMKNNNNNNNNNNNANNNNHATGGAPVNQPPAATGTGVTTGAGGGGGGGGGGPVRKGKVGRPRRSRD